MKPLGSVSSRWGRGKMTPICDLFLRQAKRNEIEMGRGDRDAGTEDGRGLVRGTREGIGLPLQGPADCREIFPRRVYETAGEGGAVFRINWIWGQVHRQG